MRDSRARRARDPRDRARPIPVGLLEVVADDLVALDEVVRPIEPVGEALVQLGAGRLGQRLVCRVANQQVPEAEAFVLGEGRRGRADELLAHERREMRLDRRPHGNRSEHGNRAAMEDLALDRSALHDDAHVTVERVDRACRSAWIVGGTTISPSPPCSRTIASISSTKSGLPAEADVMRSRSSGRAARP